MKQMLVAQMDSVRHMHHLYTCSLSLEKESSILQERIWPPWVYCRSPLKTHAHLATDMLGLHDHLRIFRKVKSLH